MKRDSSIELYRCFLMLGICVLHAAYAMLGPFHWLDTGLAWCVDGFVFISGYFGCRFSLRKIFRLYLTALWCGIVVVTGWWIFARSNVCSKEWLCSVGFSDIPNWNLYAYAQALAVRLNHWFLTAYVLMLCLIPLVNLTLDAVWNRQSTGGALMPFLIAVFGWGLSTELPILHRWVPHAIGLGSFTGLTLTGCYVCGRFFRHYESCMVFKTRTLIAALVVLLLINTFGNGWLGHYASPFAVLTAAVVFMLFKRIVMPSSLSWFVLILSPSMFSVYLLSGFRGRFDMMMWIARQLPEIYTPLACAVSALLVFIVCCIVDIFRRVFVYWCSSRTGRN